MNMFKLLFAATIAAGFASATQAAPVARTTVTKVHGPLKVLPHHGHKYCRTHWAHHHRVKKCWYH